MFATMPRFNLSCHRELVNHLAVAGYRVPRLLGYDHGLSLVTETGCSSSPPYCASFGFVDGTACFIVRRGGDTNVYQRTD